MSCRSCLIPAVLIAFLPWLSRTVLTWLIKNLRMNKNQRKNFLLWKRRILLSKIKTFFAFSQFFVLFITFRKLSSKKKFWRKKGNKYFRFNSSSTSAPYSESKPFLIRLKETVSRDLGFLMDIHRKSIVSRSTADISRRSMKKTEANKSCATVLLST